MSTESIHYNDATIQRDGRTEENGIP